MLSYHQAYYQLKRQLEGRYETGEAVAIAHEVLEAITGLGRADRLVAKDTVFSEGQQHAFEKAAARLMKGEPLQYVTGVQWFLGQPFRVTADVLIPRPETEELVLWIVEDSQDQEGQTILDIGSGSGCIPVSLGLKMPTARITGIDVSNGALKVAASNASRLGVSVSLMELDFLQEDQWERLGQYDVIVSNPPYIPFAEKETLEAHVRDYEPEAALFVRGNDPLLFYRYISIFAATHLAPGGAIYCELHRDYATAAAELFRAQGYVPELREDMHGNPRMLRCSR